MSFVRGDDEIAVVLSNFLQSNTTLSDLRWSLDVPIGLLAASTLARAVTKNSTLKYLGLRSNSIEDQGAIAFADALLENSTLTQLHLFCNGISDLGTEVTCKALHSNHVMTHFNLRGGQKLWREH